jgi:hypothetical protein
VLLEHPGHLEVLMHIPYYSKKLFLHQL